MILLCPNCGQSFLNQNTTRGLCPHCSFNGDIESFQKVQEVESTQHTNLPPKGSVKQPSRELLKEEKKRVLEERKKIEIEIESLDYETIIQSETFETQVKTETPNFKREENPPSHPPKIENKFQVEPFQSNKQESNFFKNLNQSTESVDTKPEPPIEVEEASSQDLLIPSSPDVKIMNKRRSTVKGKFFKLLLFCLLPLIGIFLLRFFKDNNANNYSVQDTETQKSILPSNEQIEAEQFIDNIFSEKATDQRQSDFYGTVDENEHQSYFDSSGEKAKLLWKKFISKENLTNTEGSILNYLVATTFAEEPSKLSLLYKNNQIKALWKPFYQFQTSRFVEFLADNMAKSAKFYCFVKPHHDNLNLSHIQKRYQPLEIIGSEGYKVIAFADLNSLSIQKMASTLTKNQSTLYLLQIQKSSIQEIISETETKESSLKEIPQNRYDNPDMKALLINEASIGEWRN